MRIIHEPNKGSIMK